MHNCQIKALHQLYFKNRGPVDRENSLLTNWWSISKVHNSSQWKLKPTMSEYNWSELVFFNLVICLLNETPWISERYFCWPVLGVQGLIRVKESFFILKISIYLICISCATLLKKKKHIYHPSWTQQWGSPWLPYSHFREINVHEAPPQMLLDGIFLTLAFVPWTW